MTSTISCYFLGEFSNLGLYMDFNCILVAYWLSKQIQSCCSFVALDSVYRR
jgi:hypothetical protein